MCAPAIKRTGKCVRNVPEWGYRSTDPRGLAAVIYDEALGTDTPVTEGLEPLASDFPPSEFACVQATGPFSLSQFGARRRLRATLSSEPSMGASDLSIGSPEFSSRLASASRRRAGQLTFFFAVGYPTVSDRQAASRTHRRNTGRAGPWQERATPRPYKTDNKPYVPFPTGDGTGHPGACSAVSQSRNRCFWHPR